MRQSDYSALFASVASASAAAILVAGGVADHVVPAALSLVAFALSLGAFVRGVIAGRDEDMRRRKDGNALDLPDDVSDGSVMSIVSSIREDQSASMGKESFIAKYPGLSQVVNSRNIDEVYANIDSVYESYRRTGAVSRELMDRLVVDCIVLLPLADSVMKSIPAMTEEAAFTVMEKFMVVREASAGAAEKARRLREEIADTSSANSVQFTADRTRQAVKKEREVVKELSRTLRENREHLSAMGKEIESGLDLLGNIEDITERSKLIAFNMSIEAARIGERGKGFKVIIAELHRLNEKTFDFSRRVSVLLGKFREYNIALASNIEQKSGEVIVEVEKGMDAAESSVESLISASERTQRFTQDIASMSESIDHDLDGVLESLQFQDITRQMIEGAQDIIAILKSTLDGCLSIDGVSVDRELRNRRFEKLRDELVMAAKTKGEKKALMEVTL